MRKTLMAAMVVASLAVVGHAVADTPPAGFDTWFAEQCPQGAVLGLVDEGTGRLVRSAPCAQALADPAVRAQLVDLYQVEVAERSPGAEGVGVAQEPWSPFGLACGLVTVSLGLLFNPPGGSFGCNDPHADNPTACAVATGGGSAILSLLCAFI